MIRQACNVPSSIALRALLRVAALLFAVTHATPSWSARFEQGLSLDLSQRYVASCKTLLLRTALLRHEAPERAVQGISGILKANQILEEKQEVGVLIGGLADEIWTEDSTPAKVDAHKDVDVMVLSTNSMILPTEGGVDWWLPQSNSAGIRYWSNFGSVRLGFGIEINSNRYPSIDHVPPGLYFLSYADTAEMRIIEAKSIPGLRVRRGDLENFGGKVINRLSSRINEDLFRSIDPSQRILEHRFSGAYGIHWNVKIYPQPESLQGGP